MRARKKPVEIECWKLPAKDPFYPDDAPEWVLEAVVRGDLQVNTQKILDEMCAVWSVKSKEGWVTISPGNYLMKDKHGLYFCHADIFEESYEVIDG